VMGLFHAVSDEVDEGEFIPQTYGLHTDHGFLHLLEKLSAIAPERVRPALPEVIAALERELDRDWLSVESTECKMCGHGQRIGRVAFAEPAVEFLTAYVEDDPETVRAAIPSLIEVLNPEATPGTDCDRTVSELLLALVEYVPEEVAAGRETYLRVARKGVPSNPPQSTVIESDEPRVRETGAMEPTAITEGLGSEYPVCRETMAKAAAELAESDPDSLSSSLPDLIALLDFETHYTICGAAATALGHLDATEAVEPLCDLYADAEDGELGTDDYVQERVAGALDRIEAAPIRSESRINTREDPVCASCGNDLGDYGLPEWCPGCGNKIY
jgi:hypothetical protein